MGGKLVWNENEIKEMRYLVARDVRLLLKHDIISPVSKPSNLHNLFEDAIKKPQVIALGSGKEHIAYGLANFIASVKKMKSEAGNGQELDADDKKLLEFIYRLEFLKLLQETLPHEGNEGYEKLKTDTIAAIEEFHKQILAELQCVNEEYTHWNKSELNKVPADSEKAGFLNWLLNMLNSVFESDKSQLPATSGNIAELTHFHIINLMQTIQGKGNSKKEVDNIPVENIDSLFKSEQPKPEDPANRTELAKDTRPKV